MMATIISNVNGQEKEREAVLKRLEALSQTYTKASYLSFDVKYRYALESDPTRYLDSLNGSFKLNGNSYWYELDNTEFTGNDSMNITIFKDDKIIYLNDIRVHHSATPIAILDSVIAMNQYNRVSTEKAGGEERIQIDFAEGFMYKQVKYVIDEKTGYLKRITTKVLSSEMYDPAVKSMFENPSEFGILDLEFTNYKTGSFTSEVFSQNMYLQKSGDKYSAGSRYNGYQLINVPLQQ